MSDLCRKRTATLTVSLVLATLLGAACTHKATPETRANVSPSAAATDGLPRSSTGDSGTSASSSTSARSAAAKPTRALTVPTKVPNEPVTIKEVTVTRCSSMSPGWRATGTVTNRSKKEQAYTITVFFTDAGATVVGYGSAKVTVPAAGSGSWTVADHAAPKSVARCVLRGAATT